MKLIAAIVMCFGVVGFGQDAQLGDVKISLVRAWVGPAEFKSFDGKPERTEETYLQLDLKMQNTSDAKKLEYRSWRGHPMQPKQGKATAVDDLGNSYDVNYGPMMNATGTTGKASIYPGKSVSDRLFFEVPVSKAKTFTVTLPGGNCGQEGSQTIQVDLSKL